MCIEGGLTGKLSISTMNKFVWMLRLEASAIGSLFSANSTTDSSLSLYVPEGVFVREDNTSFVFPAMNGSYQLRAGRTVG